MDSIHEAQSIYEIGYLISGSVSEDAVSGESESIKKILADNSATVIAEGAPHRQDLSYEMRVKKVSGSYEKFKSAYFGWIKFEVGSNAIEGIKQRVENLPSILRLLVISTVRDNTFLGKHAPAVLTRPVSFSGERTPSAEGEEKKEVTPATIEEMDKSIDEMVKEAV